MDANRQAISETIEAAVELLTTIRLGQSACQRLLDLAHGDLYAKAHDICADLHRVRQGAEQLQQLLDAALEPATALVDTPTPASKAKRAKAQHKRHPSHYNYCAH
jgi:predicted deacylase